MKERKPSPFVGRLRSFADSAASELQNDLAEVLNADDYLDEAEKRACVRSFLQDELVHFYFKALQLQLSDPDGASFIRRATSRRNGRKSAELRFENSEKLRFVRWAIREKQRAPHLTKNALADRYAKAHPGTIMSSVRGYLAKGELLKIGVDWDSITS